jgi:hypothetical protein
VESYFHAAGYGQCKALSPAIPSGQDRNSLGRNLFSPGTSMRSSRGRRRYARDARWNGHAHGQPQ